MWARCENVAPVESWNRGAQKDQKWSVLDMVAVNDPQI